MDDDSTVPGPELPDDKMAKLRPSIQGYDLLESIGTGLQATVYRAVDRKTGIIVAVKVLSGGSMTTAEAHERYETEVRILKSIDHSNVVRLITHDKSPAHFYYLVMEHVNGPHLQEFLSDVREGRRILPEPDDLLKIFRKICAGMQAAHLWGIVHRDLSPDNIRIDQNGEPKIVDFGLARTAFERHFRNKANNYSENVFLGKLPYASPEYLEGRPPDIRSDVYALGVILYEILTDGESPHSPKGTRHEIACRVISEQPTPPSKRLAARRDGPRQVMSPHKTLVKPTVNESIERVVLKALAKNPDDRYQSAGELEREITLYLAGRPALAPMENPRRRSRTSWRWAGVALLGVVAAALTFGVLRSRRVPQPDSTIPRDRTAPNLVSSIPAMPAPSRIATSATTQAALARPNPGVEAWNKLRKVPPEVLYGFSDLHVAVGVLTFDPHHNWLRAATTADAGPAVIWRLSDGHAVSVEQNASNAFEFSPDGEWCFIPGALFSLKTGQRREHGSAIEGTRGRFSNDGSRFAGAGTVESNGVRVYRVADGTKIFDQRTFFPPWLRGCSLDLSPDGKRVAAAGGADTAPDDRGIQIWDVDAAREFPRVQWSGGARIRVRFSSDGLRLCAVQAFRVALYEVETGKTVKAFRLPGPGIGAHHGELLQTAGKLVVACWDETGTITIWDPSTATILTQKQIDHDWASPPLFSDDGRRMLTVDSHGIVIAWDLDRITPVGRCATKLPGHVTALAVSLDCNLAAAGDDQGNVCVWRL